MTSNLDLEPDDVDDLYETVGQAFGISDREWMDWRGETAGELEAWLKSRFNDAEAEQGACMTTMAFLRLRAALAHERRLRPAASLAELAEGEPRKLIRSLEKATGLQLPSAHMTRAGGWLAFLFFLGLPLGFAANAFLHIGTLLIPALFSWPLMVAVMMLDRGQLPEGVVTLGDLAREAAPLNFGRLAQQGGAVRADGLWDALTRAIGSVSEVPRESIGRDTRLFATVH